MTAHRWAHGHVDLYPVGVEIPVSKEGTRIHTLLGGLMESRPASTRGDDAVAALLGLWVVGALYYDGWALVPLLVWPA